MNLIVFENLDPADQFDHAAPHLRVFHVGQGYLGDSLRMHLIGVHMLAKRQRRQDADLAAGIHSFHVRSGVVLRVAELLR